MASLRLTYRIGLHVVLFCVLTIISQVGGIVYIISNILGRIILKNRKPDLLKKIISISLFSVLYTLISVFIIPHLAKMNGRIPLPKSSKTITAKSPMFYILNRHYVSRDLLIATTGVSTALQARNSNFKILYLDAGFPFLDGFPLLPHLSHNNGKKLDITLVYKESKTGIYSSSTPTHLGYGHSELPLPRETDRPKECAEKGYWKYSFLQKLLPRNENSNLEFDPAFTKALLLEFAKYSLVKRIFIEPHLLDRMGLGHPKIRFQGCHSVRHDDHIHIEVY